MTERARDQAERAEESPIPPPRIYAASLSDYNAGRLHGAWIDADQEADELHTAVTAMLAASSEPCAEEWAIHDYEGFGPVELSEYETLERVSLLATGITEHGLGFAAWAATAGTDPAALVLFEEAYRGHWDSLTAYAEELLDDLGASEVLEQVPDWLQPYMQLDVEGFARDLRLGGDVQTVEGDGGVWVFGGAVS
jgi:antirestriction protein